MQVRTADAITSRIELDHNGGEGFILIDDLEFETIGPPGPTDTTGRPKSWPRLDGRSVGQGESVGDVDEFFDVETGGHQLHAVAVLDPVE